MSNPYQNSYLKAGDLGGWLGNQIDQKTESAMQKFHHAAEKQVPYWFFTDIHLYGPILTFSPTVPQISQWLGIPQPVVHDVSVLMFGDGTSHIEMALNNADKIGSFGRVLSSARPFDLIDASSRSLGIIQSSGAQLTSRGLSIGLNVAKGSVSSEVAAIATYGFFRGAIPSGAVPSAFPGEAPGCNPHLGSSPASAHISLGIIVLPDAQLQPGSTSDGVLQQSNQWSRYPACQATPSSELWDSSSPTSKGSSSS